MSNIDPQSNRLNLNNAVNNNDTQNTIETPSISPDATINMLQMMSASINVGGINSVSNVSDFKRELVEDSILQMDRIQSSSMPANPCPNCSSDDCIKACPNGGCNCSEVKCCWNNSNCWEHFCKPQKFNNDELGCCNDSDGLCHATSPEICCKCNKFCFSGKTDPQGPWSGFKIPRTWYPDTDIAVDWPDNGVLTCVNSNWISTGIVNFQFATYDPNDTVLFGCPNGTLIWGELPEPKGVVLKNGQDDIESNVTNTTGIDVMPHDRVITCSMLWNGSDAGLIKTWLDRADYGCDVGGIIADLGGVFKPYVDLNHESVDGCDIISDPEQRRLCWLTVNKPINLKPDTDSFYCYINECPQCLGTGTTNQKVCKNDDVVGCSCISTIAYFKQDGTPVYCNELTPSEVEGTPCQIWIDFDLGCSKDCTACLPEPSAGNYCVVYNDCINQQGDYAAGQSCYQCPCGSNPCLNSTCKTSTKTDYENCIKPVANGGCKCSSLCCSDPCSTCPTDYWSCKENPACVIAGCCSKNCDRDCGASPCTNANSNCRKGKNDQDGCCVCADSICITTTKQQYNDCMDATNSLYSACRQNNCCTNPCTRTPPTNITSYKQCIAGQGIYAGYDPACCGSFNCTWCGANPVAVCANSEPLCSSNGCCVCNIPACATTTKAQYENCIKAQGGCPTPDCCVDPCASIPLPTSGVTYNQCLTRSGAIYGSLGQYDTDCCGGWNCNWCGATSTEKCANQDFPEYCSISPCCGCTADACKPSNTVYFTKQEWQDCMNTCDSSCCGPYPCMNSDGSSPSTEYWTCDTQDRDYDSVPFSALGCCPEFSCSECFKPIQQCTAEDDNNNCSVCDCIEGSVSLPGGCFAPQECVIGECCKCVTEVDCHSNTKQEYENCKQNCGAAGGNPERCCTDPCRIDGVPVLNLITNVSLYDDCIALRGIFSGLTDNNCCEEFKCKYCGDSSTWCSTSQTDPRCKNPSNPTNDCCECNNSECDSTTKTAYNNCLQLNALSVPRCVGCCNDPCVNMPSITTVEEWRACKAAETGAVNKYKPYTDKGCSCGVFTCSLCKPSACANPDPLCQASTTSPGGCCVCNSNSCKSTTNQEYINCRSNSECLSSGCCIDPCSAAPKDFNECIRSPYLAKGCCVPPVGPCTECAYCQGQDGQAGTCSTLEEYNACLGSATCSANNCCIYEVTDPCEGCSDDCNTCRSNATCVANGCCRFNCSQMTCPDSSTLSGYNACMNNQCCKTEGCCAYPCTGCSKIYSECIKNQQCKLAGCCVYVPQPCDSCVYPTNQQCLQDLYCVSNNCCAPDPCFGCLTGDPYSYYTCMTDNDCRTNGCCGEAPCTLNNCFTSTKQEYLECLSNPDCNPPVQDPEHPCCDNPCKTCSTNYFECMRNPACVRAGCCASAPTCLDCKTDPAHPNASCTHPDPRCSNAPDATGVQGCCNCKSSRCQDDTRNQYTTCINKQNKSFCMDTWGTGAPCCTNPCSSCPPYKESAYPDCIISPGCANKGCCLEPPPDPCAGCKNNPNCSSITECTRKGCCAETPPCEACSSEYNTCITDATCVARGCCPPNPCTLCNRSRTKEGYAECSANATCVAYNCCNNPCEPCLDYYYKECQTDIYCVANDCCPPEPCSICSENYDECMSNETCRLYCCCKG